MLRPYQAIVPHSGVPFELEHSTTSMVAEHLATAFSLLGFESLEREDEGRSSSSSAILSSPPNDVLGNDDLGS